MQSFSLQWSRNRNLYVDVALMVTYAKYQTASNEYVYMNIKKSCGFATHPGFYCIWDMVFVWNIWKPDYSYPCLYDHNSIYLLFWSSACGFISLPISVLSLKQQVKRGSVVFHYSTLYQLSYHNSWEWTQFGFWLFKHCCHNYTAGLTSPIMHNKSEKCNFWTQTFYSVFWSSLHCLSSYFFLL